MSRRPGSAAPVAAGPPSDRLKAVLAAGLEQKQQRQRRSAAPTDTLVKYEKDTDWSRELDAKKYPNGPRFTYGCPEDEPDCKDDDDKVPVDPITLDEFDNNKEVMILGSGHVYNPETLAKWLVQKNSRKCIYRDYRITDEELQELGLEEVDGKIGYKSQPNAFSAMEVTRQRTASGDVAVYRNSDDGPVLVGMEFRDSTVAYYEGPHGRERMVRKEYPISGANQYYEGPQGAEHTVRLEYENGIKVHYEGSRGEEHRVLEENPDGYNTYYEGLRSQERIVRKEYTSGYLIYYEGPRGEERMVRDECQGTERYYEGPIGQERMVRKEDQPSGINQY